MFVVGVSMIKDAYEDNKRRKKDNEDNSAIVLTSINGEEFEETKSEDVEVGCLVKVKEDEPFPCDLIMVSSSLPRKIAYVETKNLDGETNLKQKIVTEDVSLHFDEKDKVSKSQIDSFRGMEIDCEGPNEFLYNFKGVITS